MGVHLKRDKKKFLILGATFFGTFLCAFLFFFNKEVVNLDVYYVETYFSDVQGLKEAGPVKYVGIQIGHVDQVKLLNSNKVKVVMALDKTYNIPDTVIAQVQSSGVLGDKFISLSGSGSTWLYDSHKKVIESKDPISLGELYEKSKKIIDNLHDFSVIVNEGLKNFNFFDQLHKTTYNLNELTQEANTLIFQIGGCFDTLEEFFDEELDNMSDLILACGQIGANFTQTTEKFNVILDKVDKSSGTLGMLLNDKRMYQNFTRFGERVARRPSALIFSLSEEWEAEPDKEPEETLEIKQEKEKPKKQQKGNLFLKGKTE